MQAKMLNRSEGSAGRRQPNKRSHNQLAGRVFGVPLLLDESKADTIARVFIDRMNGTQETAAQLNASDWREPGEFTVDINTGIAIVPVIGSITRRKTWLDAYSGMTSYDDIFDAISGAVADARVRAVLLQIDSFGGEAAGCFELCEKIYQLRQAKPIWASADVDALSAAYALGSSGVRFFVAPRGSAGSVGAVCIHLDRSRHNEQEGLTFTVLRAGARKAEGSSLERLGNQAAEKMLTSLERCRTTFCETVSRNRPGLSVEALMATEAQWYDPEDALALNLVDGVLPFDGVFAELASELASPSAAPEPPASPPAPIEPEPEEEREELMEPDNVASIDQARTQAQAAAAARATEINDLCKLVRRPELAGDFIASQKSVADVRAELINMQVAPAPAGGSPAPAAAELSNLNPGASQHQPALGGGINLALPSGPMTSEQSAGWDTAFGRARAAREAVRR